jgi:transposase
MKLSVGVDLHKGQFTVYWLSGDRSVGEFERYGTKAAGYEEFEGRLREYVKAGCEVEVAVESTGNTRYFKARVERAGAEVKVINTLKFKVVNESVKKTDRHDAKTIAEFLEKDMLPESRLCSEESEQLRRLLKSRKLLVRTEVSLKNQVHGLLLSYGIETRRGQLQSKKERRRILDVLAEQGLAGHAVKPLLETIDRVEGEVKKLGKLLIQRVEGDRMVELLMSIPGTGIITASTVRAYADEISRFSGYKQFSAYAGLAPWVQNSNERERYGSITKRGPEPLRTALVQMVLGMVRNQRLTGTYRLMLRYQAMKPHKGSGKTIIATARKLSKIVWYMLRNGEPFDPLRMTDPHIRKIAFEMRAAVADAA